MLLLCYFILKLTLYFFVVVKQKVKKAEKLIAILHPNRNYKGYWSIFDHSPTPKIPWLAPKVSFSFLSSSLFSSNSLPLFLSIQLRELRFMYDGNKKIIEKTEKYLNLEFLQVIICCSVVAIVAAPLLLGYCLSPLHHKTDNWEVNYRLFAISKE